jgi:hypothetical protein
MPLIIIIYSICLQKLLIPLQLHHEVILSTYKLLIDKVRFKLLLSSRCTDCHDLYSQYKGIYNLLLFLFIFFFTPIRSHERFFAYPTEISSTVSHWYFLEEWPWSGIPLDGRQWQCQEGIWRGEHQSSMNCVKLSWTWNLFLFESYM